MGTSPRAPLIVYLSPTELCNFHCKMCKIGRPDSIDPKEEMDTERILSLLVEMKECGTKILGIWGGEPLIHKDLDRILKAAHSLGMYIYLTTNGYLLTEEKRKVLIDSGVNSVSVSLDHTTAEGHDKLRGKEGAFDHVTLGTKELVNEGKGRLNIGINMLVHKKSISEIVPMAKFSKNLGIHWLKFMPAHAGYPFNDKLFEDSEMLFSQDDIERLEQAIKEARTILRREGLYTNSLPYLQGMIKYFKGEDLSHICHAGYLTANVSSIGNVTICTKDKRIAGNVKNKHFREVWFSEEFERIRKHPNRAVCHHCWQSCFAEPSLRLNLSFHLRNISTSLKELAFVGKV